MADGETSALLRVVPAESEAAPTAAPGPDATQWWRCWRYRVALTAALGEAIVYGQRISVPIALVVMQAELGWDKEVQGIVMTGFWVGYACMQIPGGWLTTRWGPRRVVGAGLAVSSLMHLLMPTAAVVSPGAMVGLRVLQGLSQGVMVPGYAVLWSTWAPPSERSRLSSMPQVGGYVGTIAQLAIAGWQIDSNDADPSLLAVLLGGWPAVFVANASLGLIWMLLWFSVVYDAPDVHPTCPTSERDHINAALAAEVEASDAAAEATAARPGGEQQEEPVKHSEWSCGIYRRMSRSRPVWGICFASFCHNTGNYMLIDGFPAYMRDVTGASLTNAGLASAAPQLALVFLCSFGAVMSDWLRGPKGMKTGSVRRLMHVVGTGINAILLLLVGAGLLQGISEGAIVAVLAMSVGVAGLTVGGGFNVNHLDILPTAAGLLLGVVNMFGSAAGALAPYTMARLTEYPKVDGEGRSREQWADFGLEPDATWLEEVTVGWRRVFLLAVAVDVLGIVIYSAMVSGERQQWAPRTTGARQESAFAHYNITT